jgi:hypothetical protein
MNTLKKALAALAIVAGLILSSVAPWWAVWFVCLPVVYLAALYLIKTNTTYIEKY